MKTKGFNMQIRRWFCLLLFGAWTAWAVAQPAYPNKAIKVIVPFPPGGVTDLGARIVLDRMAIALGQPMVIDNRPGAGSKLGTHLVMKAPKDGYTLYFNNNSYSILSALDAEAGYDAESDLTPVAMGATYGMAVVVNPAEPAQNLLDFLESARKNPGKFTFGSAGVGSGSHFMGEFLKQIARVDMLHIPFKSTQLATQEVAAGRVNLAFEGSVKPYVDAGKVRILAVTDTQRDPRFPQVPTVTEAGLPEFTYISWLGLLVPNGVPEPIVKRLNEAFNEATMDPVVKRKLADMGLNATATSPTQFTQVIREEVQRYKKMSQSISLK